MKKLLVFVFACLASTAMFAQQTHWTMSTAASSAGTPVASTNCFIRGNLYIDGELSGSSDLEIGVFDQDEICRGVKRGQWVAGNYNWYYYNMTCKGYDGCEYHFRIWDHQAGEERTDLTFDYDFEGDGLDFDAFVWVSMYSYGAAQNPIHLNFATSSSTITLTKEIIGYVDEDNPRGFYLIASPMVEEITPSVENGFLTDAYDLYFFNGSVAGEEWQNYEADAFTLTSGKGYLYASQENTTLTFYGTPYTGEGVVELEYDGNTTFGGWNLVGNPFTDPATPDREYYVLNPELEDVDFIVGTQAIPAMEGAFVVAEGEGENVTFIPANESKSNPSLALNLTQGRGLVDRAVVRFSEGRMLPKFQMNPNHTKVYIPQDGTDYAVVSAPEMGEMPVNFKAETNGSYTMSFGSENVTFSYLHLIDNLTGADVDLLATPSYTFDATTTDYASRFRLVFATGGNNDGDSFAFFSNGSFVVSNEGEATLQVVDVMGRILKSENISGSASVKVDAASGVYMLRLVNGNDVKVQKVVVE